MVSKSRWPWLVVAVPLLAAVLFPLLLNRPSDVASVVVYCAHDSVFADTILRDFEQRTGIRVDVRYDEESNKSLGLTSLLLKEQGTPRCDVFWNNQTLGTIRLQKAGLLQPCEERVFARIPRQFRDPQHHWCGFSGRLRVWIVNTDLQECSADAVASRLQSPDLSRVGIAIPLFGTTLTHYTELCHELGLAGLQEWHASLHQRGIREARGNGAVRDLVAEGVCDLGLTDTDDVFAAIDARKPVEMLPYRLPGGRTICIPNTVAMIRNCPHPREALTLIEFLLSEETERRLAESPARQIPLGPMAVESLPEDVQRLLPWAADSTDPGQAADMDAICLEWLTGIYNQSPAVNRP